MIFMVGAKAWRLLVTECDPSPLCSHNPLQNFSGADPKLVNFIVPTSPLGRLPQHPTAVVVKVF